MNIIPLQPLASQTLSVSLVGQSCKIAVYQKSTGLFMDLSVNNTVLFTGAICHSGSLLVRYPYLGFIGDLAFRDTQGGEDPSYTGLGTRWQLIYLSPSDVATGYVQ